MAKQLRWDRRWEFRTVVVAAGLGFVEIVRRIVVSSGELAPVTPSARAIPSVPGLHPGDEVFDGLRCGVNGFLCRSGRNPGGETDSQEDESCDRRRGHGGGHGGIYALGEGRPHLSRRDRLQIGYSAPQLLQGRPLRLRRIDTGRDPPLVSLSGRHGIEIDQDRQFIGGDVAIAIDDLQHRLCRGIPKGHEIGSGFQTLERITLLRRRTLRRQRRQHRIEERSHLVEGRDGDDDMDPLAFVLEDLLGLRHRPVEPGEAGAGAVSWTKQNLDTVNFTDAISLIQNDDDAYWCERAGVATPIQDRNRRILLPSPNAKVSGARGRVRGFFAQQRQNRTFQSLWKIHSQTMWNKIRVTAM